MAAADVNTAFSSRLNLILDETEFPAKGKGRQGELATLFDVSQKGARKWLECEAIPRKEKIAEIAGHFSVNESWLEYGTGPMYETAGGSAEELVQRIGNLPPGDQAMLISILDWIEQKAR